MREDTHDDQPDAPDLAHLWRRLAARPSDAQLAALVVASVVLIVAYGVLIAVNARAALRWWPATLAPLLVGAFGLWAIADREWRERPSRTLAGLKIVAAGAAGLTAALAAIEFLHLAVGTWIS